MSFAESPRSKPEPSRNELIRVSLALRVTSAASRSLTTASDVTAWLNQICHIAVESGGYPLAWVAFADGEDRKTVSPVAQAGFEPGYLKHIQITPRDKPRGPRAAGTPISPGKHYVADIISNDHPSDPRHEKAIRLSRKSALCLPLISAGRPFGFLGIYSDQVDAFGDNEVHVLTELANDLAQGIILITRAGAQQNWTSDAFAESQRKLHQAERISQLAQWERDLESDILHWSDGLYRILGLEPQSRIFRFSEFLQLIHPDDRQTVRQTVADAIANSQAILLDYRVVRPDGQLRYIHGEGDVVRDQTGRPLRTVGFLQDVTELHAARIDLENANRALEQKNTALHEVLTDIQVERDKIGQRINKNVQELIQPLLQSLRQGATRRQQRAIEQIETSLKEIISPFVAKLAHAVNKLTPTELRICSFIIRGLAVKQIADLEDVSPQTIAAHRRNIRHKLHIANQKINLTTYLRDFYREDVPELRKKSDDYIG